MDAAYISGFYTCGSPSCLKIADPKAELESKTGMASIWLLLGCVELIFGSVTFGVTIYYTRRIKWTSGQRGA